MNRMGRFTWLATVALTFICHSAVAAQTVTSTSTATAPVVDGKADDAAWASAQTTVVRDQVADTDVTLKTVYSGDTLYLLVTYADIEENRLHKPWVWNKDLDAYMLGDQREDGFAFKWNMEAQDLDLSNFSDDSYTADVWYWKANRTDPVGYADDKMHILSDKSAPKATPVTSKSGKQQFLQRLGDEGTSSTTKQILTKHAGDIEPQYLTQEPSGSRADVRAKGVWANGLWTIEFSRKLQTGHADDIQFDKQGSFLFGLSVYGLYAQPIDKSKAHLYGQGRISEPLVLVFK